MAIASNICFGKMGGGGGESIESSVDPFTSITLDFDNQVIEVVDIPYSIRMANSGTPATLVEVSLIDEMGQVLETQPYTTGIGLNAQINGSFKVYSGFKAGAQPKSYKVQSVATNADPGSRVGATPYENAFDYFLDMDSAFTGNLRNTVLSGNYTNLLPVFTVDGGTTYHLYSADEVAISGVTTIRYFAQPEGKTNNVNCLFLLLTRLEVYPGPAWDTINYLVATGNPNLTEMDPKIGQLSNLDHLVYAACGLTSLPVEIASLPMLVFDVSDNPITGPLDAAFAAYTIATSIKLNDTQINSVDDAIGGWIAVQTLHLHYTQLASIGSGIGNCVACTELKTHHNPNLTSIHSSASNLLALEDFDTNNCPLLTALPDFSASTGMLKFDAHNCGLAAIAWSMAAWAAIQEIELQNNALADDPPAVENAASLVLLDLDGNQYTSEQIQGLMRRLDRAGVTANCVIDVTSNPGSDDAAESTDYAIAAWKNLPPRGCTITPEVTWSKCEIEIDTRNTAGGTASNQIRWPGDPSGTDPVDIEWGDGTSETVGRNPVHTYEVEGIYTITARIKPENGQMNLDLKNSQNSGDRLKFLRIKKWGNCRWWTFNGGFKDASNLVEDPGAGAPNTSSGNISMFGFFEGCNLVNPTTQYWDVRTNTSMGNMMLFSGYNQTNYDPTLVAWEANTPVSGATLHAGSAQYSAGPHADARQRLITDAGWGITDGGQAP